MTRALPAFIALLTAAIVPFVTTTPQTAFQEAAFPGWPTHFAERILQERPLDDREQAFAADFPGRIARFTAGNDEVVIRWVAQPTRRLHPSADCFRGLGYTTEPAPARIDENEHRWACFHATRENDRQVVCERIYDERGEWTDVSAWYWSAMLGQSDGPWWSITVASARPADSPDQPRVRVPANLRSSA